MIQQSGMGLLSSDCPWTREQLLDVDFLKSLGVAPHYFGLGFIQLKLNENWRIHFWVPHWPTIPGAENEQHDHRYNFQSTVLLGALTHELWAAGSINTEPSDGSMELALVSCKPGQSQEPEVVGYCQMDRIGTFEVVVGQTYSLGKQAFHQSKPTGSTVTLVKREGVEKEFARILRKPGSEWTCPFSLPTTEEQCWEQIKKMLLPQTNEFVPGYHLRPITKGVLGQTSKIREELDELDEALDQDVRIMAECELADLYGAIESFLEASFPHLDMSDLAKMSHVTRRAFLNGRRT